MALDILGPGNFVVTTLEDQSVAAIRARCHRAGIKTMVWTVDADAEIRRWLADPRVAVLITNRPADAVAMRSALPEASRAASPGP
jgi:glycerophosphoryl diester phosphodiesterase